MDPYTSSSLAFIFITVFIALSYSADVLTKENSFDSNGKCIRNGTFKDECNTCTCVKGLPAACTLINCGPKGTNGTALTTKDEALDSKGMCKKADVRFPIECNNCFCVRVGSPPGCTRMYCQKSQIRRSVRSLDESPLSAVRPWPELRRLTRQDSTAIPLITKENSLDSNGICIRNGTFSDGCNTCSCVQGSHAACTLVHCEPVVMIPREEALDEKGICKKKGMLKDELDCNTCECTPGSVPSACTEMVCERKV